MTETAEIEYEIRCEASGDVAEATDLGNALAAADQLARDHADNTARGAGGLRMARRTLALYRLDPESGSLQYDGLATTMARDGRR